MIVASADSSPGPAGAERQAKPEKIGNLEFNEIRRSGALVDRSIRLPVVMLDLAPYRQTVALFIIAVGSTSSAG